MARVPTNQVTAPGGFKKFIKPKFRSGEGRGSVFNRRVQSERDRIDALNRQRRGGGVGSSSAARRRAEEQARLEAIRKAEAIKQAEIKRQAEILAKVRADQERARKNAIQIEAIRIAALKDKILRLGGQRRLVNSIDAVTKDKLVTVTYQGSRTNERIVIIKNMTNPDIPTITKTFIRGRVSGGLITPKGRPPQDIAFEIFVPSGTGKFTKAIDVGGGNMQDAIFVYSNGKITKSTLLGKPMPQSKRFKEIAAKETLEARKQAKDVTFLGSKLFGKWLTGIEKSQGLRGQERKNLNLELRGIKDKSSPRAKEIGKKLAILTLLTEVTESSLAAKELGGIILKASTEAYNKIKKDPKMIVPISKAVAAGTVPVIRKIADGLLREVKETGELIITSPNEGIVQVGLIWLSFVSAGGIFKITGKVTKLGIKAVKNTAVGSANVIIKITKVTGTKIGTGVISRFGRAGLKLKIIDPRTKVNIVNLNKIATRITPLQSKLLIQRISKNIEKKSLIKFDAAMRGSLQNIIRNKLLVINTRIKISGGLFVSRELKHSAKKLIVRSLMAKKRITSISKFITFIPSKLASKIKKMLLMGFDPKIKTLEQTIKELEKFKVGLLNQVYLKAKNAQFDSGVRGAVKSVGTVRNLNTKAVNNIFGNIKAQLKINGITKNQFLDASVYKQIMKVRSNVPKIEALIKILKASVKGKTIKVDKVSEFYDFKRTGIVFSKFGKGGKVTSFAIEFNYIGGKVSHIGLKSGIGKGKFAFIKIYDKIRKLKGKPLRVKLKDVFIVKGKIKTTRNELKEIINTLNTLQIKKVFMNNKRLTTNELKSLKFSLFRDFSRASRHDLENNLKKLFNNKGISSTSGYSNILRVQISRDKNVVRILQKYDPKKTSKFLHFGKDGNYMEIGFSRFRIPSYKKGFTIGARKKPLPKRKPSKFKTSLVYPKTISMKIRPQNNVLVLKRPITKTGFKLVEDSIRSIQTITRPITRITQPIQVSSLKLLSRSISKVIPLLSLASSTKMKTIQKLINKSITIQNSITSTTQIHAMKTVVVTQSKLISQLKNIEIVGSPKIFTPIKPLIKELLLKEPPTKKTPFKIRLKRIEKKVKEKKKFDAFVVKFRSRGRIVTSKIPLSLIKAKDLLAYRIDRRLIRTGKIVSIGMVSKLGKLPKAIEGAFNQRKSKLRIFRLKKKRKVKFSERRFIEKRKYIGDTKSEIRLLQVARRKARATRLKNKNIKIKRRRKSKGRR